jgi:hypothetical protein
MRSIPMYSVTNMAEWRYHEQIATHRMFENESFGPTEIANIAAAYEAVLRVLGLANRSDPITETVARKIFEIARAGESDPDRIRELTLLTLGPSPRAS